MRLLVCARALYSSGATATHKQANTPSPHPVELAILDGEINFPSPSFCTTDLVLCMQYSCNVGLNELYRNTEKLTHWGNLKQVTENLHLNSNLQI